MKFYVNHFVGDVDTKMSKNWYLWKINKGTHREDNVNVM
jgi:hypothetical protein